MDFLLIGPTKLKVVINKDEAQELGIVEREGEYDNATVRVALASILKSAEECVGFTVGKEQVLVQLYPTEADGCELFVTRLFSLSDKDRKRLLSNDCLSTYTGAERLYRFDSLDSLIGAARAVFDRSGEWDVYSLDGAYYVSFTEHSVDGFSDFCIISEYATNEKSLPLSVIAERGRLLCQKNGIAVFSSL